jgi:hypothetical protein
MSELMVRHADDDFHALQIGQAAYRLGARVVSVCPYELRKKYPYMDRRNGELIGRYLLVWIELPNGVTADDIDEAACRYCMPGSKCEDHKEGGDR